jgi:peroxiredoxin
MRKKWSVGEAIPNFVARATNNPKLQFQNVAGRYIVLCFFGSATIEKNRLALQYALSRRDFFNDVQASFFGVSIDPSDEATGRVRQILAGFRFLWDDDKKISEQFGAITAEQGEKVVYRPFTLLLDHNLRVLAHIPLVDAHQHNEELAAEIAKLPPTRPKHFSAPVLMMKNVFTAEFCKQVIDLYQQNNLEKSKDWLIDDNNKPLNQAIQRQISQKLLPEIAKVFHININRIEKYAISCKNADNGKLIRHNRLNNSPKTAHRKLVVTINWNDEFEGGQLRFPEYSDILYKIPSGGTLVASCNIIQEILPITQGNKYSSMLFCYDEKLAPTIK